MLLLVVPGHGRRRLPAGFYVPSVQEKSVFSRKSIGVRRLLDNRCELKKGPATQPLHESHPREF